MPHLLLQIITAEGRGRLNRDGSRPEVATLRKLQPFLRMIRKIRFFLSFFLSYQIKSDLPILWWDSISRSISSNLLPSVRIPLDHAV
jgi:hypothetical protein